MDGYALLIIIFYILLFFIIMFYIMVQNNPDLYPPKNKHKKKVNFSRNIEKI